MTCFFGLRSVEDTLAVGFEVVEFCLVVRLLRYMAIYIARFSYRFLCSAWYGRRFCAICAIPCRVFVGTGTNNA